MASIKNQKKRTTPQSEWSDPAVPEYESDVSASQGSKAVQREHDTVLALAGSETEPAVLDSSGNAIANASHLEWDARAAAKAALQTAEGS